MTGIKKRTRREFIKKSAMAAAMVPLLLSCGQNSRSSPSVIDPKRIKRFRKRFGGQSILPGDVEYEKKRWPGFKNPAMDKHPAIIATCKNEEDVLRSVEFARQGQLEIAVRSGNHSNMGWGSCENGMVIDLSRMKGIRVDAGQKTALVTTGVVAEEILAATAPYGLAPVLGECGTVGSGIALGGGLGWLSGKYGAACDNLISAQIVTAAVESKKVDINSNEDLFWAIRGGGGNFGIATSFEYQLHPVSEILGGSLVYAVDNASAIVKFFNEFMSQAPDELQADCYLSRNNCWVESVFFGDLDKGEVLLDNFRKFKKPKEDSVKRRLFSGVYRMNVDNGSAPPKFESSKGIYIEQITDAVIDEVLDALAQAPRGSNPFFDFSHYMHGEVCRIAPHTTAFELRKPGAAHLVLATSWQDAADTESCLKWHEETFQRLQPYSGGRIFTNYMSIPGGGNAKSVYGNNFSRLAHLKKKHDPDNIFHLNQNILPG
jgi:FAD/FMN-containing dehydrogenase